jgi:hypothetical protein
MYKYHVSVCEPYFVLWYSNFKLNLKNMVWIHLSTFLSTKNYPDMFIVDNS